MKLTAEQSVYIRTAFPQMQHVADFVALLNAVKSFVYPNSTKPFTEAYLKLFVFPEERLFRKNNRNPVRYKTFTIRKKSGKMRTIHAPVKGLKAIQTCLNIMLQEVHEPHAAAMGFVPGKSIVDNARLHVGQAFVYNIDLKDFFPSIDQARVWGRLQAPPFNLQKGTPRLKIANLIAGLCCHSVVVGERIEEGTFPLDFKVQDTGRESYMNVLRLYLEKKEKIHLMSQELQDFVKWVVTEEIYMHVLPQGAPTSPTLTNIICERLDRRLTCLAARFNLRYSRYADDITFSSGKDVFVYGKNSVFLKELQQIIHGQNFRINESKTRLQKPGYRQEVTGLTVNEKPNVAKRYVKQLRRWLYLWETYGLERAQVYFQKDYLDPEKGRGYAKSGAGLPVLANVLSGKLLFLRMVKGERDIVYLKLKARLEKLVTDSTLTADVLLAQVEIPIPKLQPKKEKTPVEAALEIIAAKQEDGLAEAMNLLLKHKQNGL